MRERVTDGPVEEIAPAPTVAPAAPSPVPAAPLSVRTVMSVQRHAGNRAAAALVAREVATDAGLRIGARSGKVLELQMHLNQLDEVATELVPDSIFGPITRRAVKEFQAAHPPLKSSGVADPATLAEISAALEDPQAPEALARKLFALGSRAYDRRSFGHAYAYFTRAGELVDRPALVFSRAQALRKLGGRREEAIALYHAYLDSGHGARDKDARAGLAELETSPTGDEAADTATARKIFQHGSALYERSDYAHAYDEMTRAGELADRPALVFSRAQALRRLGGRREEAIALYKQYLASGHGDRDADARAALAKLETSPTGDEATDTASARKIFDHGSSLYEQGDYGHAYDEMTRAGELADRPALLFSRAQALRRLGGREDEAIALYEQYIAEGDGARLEDAERMLELLRTHGSGV